ncbi:4Fe-4S binding protein [Hippea maritima]|uniref:Cobyrinic acid ac-diamide synthase n=1 Tax=Hippea maritima (strain ATCC 700847 / DSM 10411 / MH2) TaxID=760142 RepID=F2LX03_HIPMA|nr:ATP-binding protein [Hippea maritima]AEA34187.1 Cobyrinic acid ac-diamide synthase [Hippea maritima DSM 10411]
MKIAVTSGKGGTGKTTIATMLAYSLDNAQYIDCDAEEPNGHLFLKPRIEKKIPYTELVPQINEDVCTFCGKCAEVCAYKALVVMGEPLKKTMFFDELCHSCGACAYVCPIEGALIEVPKRVGEIRTGKASHIDFVMGLLDIGQASATQLIATLKRDYMDDSKTVVLDSPPGTSCTVVETIDGVDFVILVAEPTPFGLSDLKLSVELVRDMGLNFGIIVNKYEKNNRLIEDYAQEETIPILYRLPFSKDIARSYSNGALPFEKFKNDFKEVIKQIEERI